ncbi:MAG: four helix bundle protein [Anaerolineales bacterium]|nr:four helix bundle protein [Anaerolineales bacterium]
MSGIKRFEDVKAWQEARILTKLVYEMTNQELFAKDFGLKDQIQRASVSIMNNVAEGFDCDSQLEFARFLGIARRSAVEVQSLLYTAIDIGYIDQQTFEKIYNQASKTKALVGGFKKYLIDYHHKNKHRP